MTNAETLLGLPLETALETLRSAGMEPLVVTTCAPRREDSPDGTLRVIRVRRRDDTVALTVRAFMDGDPRRA